jgi:hypothetical protein
MVWSMWSNGNAHRVGMSQFVDGGLMVSKSYAANAYIQRMITTARLPLRPGRGHRRQGRPFTTPGLGFCSPRTWLAKNPRMAPG